MIYFLILLSAAVAVPMSPTIALKNAHQSSMNAFSQHLEGSPYKNFILSSYAEPLLRKLDNSWTLAYIENDASLFLQDFSDLVQTTTDQLMVKMSNRYEECRAPNSLEKRLRWEIPIKVEETNTDHVDTPPSNAGTQVDAGTQVENAGTLSNTASGQESSTKKMVDMATQTELGDVSESPTIQGKFKELVKSITSFLSVTAHHTGCVRVVRVLGYVLIGSVVLAYLATFALFSVKYAKYLLNTTQE